MAKLEYFLCAYSLCIDPMLAPHWVYEQSWCLFCCTAAVCWVSLIPSVCELSKIPSLSLPPFSKGEKLLTFIVQHENSVFHHIQITLQLSNMREPGKHFNTWLKLVIDKWTALWSIFTKLFTQPFIHILLTFCSWNRSRPWESIVLVVLISCWKLYLQIK